jgi:signal transduction histidine kinase
MMNLSIRARLILAMNLLVIGVGVAVGWAGVEVSGRAIEHRLVDEPARNAAGLFGMMRLPFSGAMMARLRQILGAEVAAGPPDRLEIEATSLPDEEARALKDQLARGSLARRVSLAGKVYLVGEADAAPPEPSRAADGRRRLYVLVPEPQVEAAKRASERAIVMTTIAAIGLATALAFWLSTTISRPVRRLATRMDALSEHAADERLSAQTDAARDKGPAELVRLAKSFDRLLERLEHARRQLARSARLATLGQLAASVAHELRNPLSGIKMNAKVLADELAAAGESDSSLDRIMREADRMNLYLEELLDLASGDVTPDAPLNVGELPRVRLDTVGESVAALVEGRCRHGGVEIRRHWDAGLSVRADETRIRQVILNLVLNALDAMPSGGTLTLSTGAGPGRTVRFAVADTGRGVQAPEGADVFEPFVTTKSGGVGLGLYVCRRNVERHGGRIDYESSGNGTTFWFELPASD